MVSSGVAGSSFSSSIPPPPQKVHSNLENFLHAVTPNVPLRKQSMEGLQKSEVGDDIEYFYLGDLWQSYQRSSVYGLGVPVVLNGFETTVQYYTPHLSAIHIYTKSKELSSDSITYNTIDEPLHETRRLDPQENPYFHYDETLSPFWRVPFIDKMAEFVDEYPGLNSLRNIDLSPASWVSIVWNPIYHIPLKGKVEDFSTHFLTYHTLSSHFQDRQGSSNFTPKQNSENKPKTIALPPFGLSTFKMSGDIWINGDACDYQKLIDLHSAADSWLKQLKIHHGDFDYYKWKNIELSSIFK